MMRLGGHRFRAHKANEEQNPRAVGEISKGVRLVQASTKIKPGGMPTMLGIAEFLHSCPLALTSVVGELSAAAR